MAAKKKKPGRVGRPATGKTPMHGLRVPNEEWERWKKTAELEGVTLSDWLRAIANRAAAE